MLNQDVKKGYEYARELLSPERVNFLIRSSIERLRDLEDLTSCKSARYRSLGEFGFIVHGKLHLNLGKVLSPLEIFDPLERTLHLGLSDGDSAEASFLLEDYVDGIAKWVSTFDTYDREFYLVDRDIATLYVVLHSY